MQTNADPRACVLKITEQERVVVVALKPYLPLPSILGGCRPRQIGHWSLFLHLSLSFFVSATTQLQSRNPEMPRALQGLASKRGKKAIACADQHTHTMLVSCSLLRFLTLSANTTALEASSPSLDFAGTAPDVNVKAFHRSPKFSCSHSPLNHAVEPLFDC